MAPTLREQLAAVRAEIEQQRQLMQNQVIRLRRQRRQLEQQSRRSADMQLELDMIKATLRRAVTIAQPGQRRPHKNGNGNGHGRAVAANASRPR